MISEIYYFFITGILIFAFQQILIEFWIKPLKNFYEILGRLESLLVEYAYLSQEIYGKNKITDKKLQDMHTLLRKYTGDLMASFSSLNFLEKLWLSKFSKLDIQEAKNSLIRLSNYLGNVDPSGHINLRILSSEEISNIRKNLKFNS